MFAAAGVFVLSWVFRIGRFLFFCGLLAIVVCTVSEVFSLDIWGAGGNYPGFDTDEQGQTQLVGYGRFLWQWSVFTLSVGLIALVSLWGVGRIIVSLGD